MWKVGQSSTEKHTFKVLWRWQTNPGMSWGSLSRSGLCLQSLMCLLIEKVQSIREMYFLLNSFYRIGYGFVIVQHKDEYQQ